MIIEYLYPEIANLFGDSANFKYLRESVPGAEFIETSLTDTPAFAEKNVDLIYMGSMSEEKQLLALEHLTPYRDNLSELISGGTHFLCTGNSFEIFGNYIENSGNHTDCLGLLDFYSVTDTSKRYNGFFLGEHDGIKITAFNSRFSNAYPQKCASFAKVLRGRGLNPESGFEGVVKNNFVGTYLLGPLLVLNPLYFSAFMEELGIVDSKPAFFKASMDAYKVRLDEFEDEKRKLD